MRAVPFCSATASLRKCGQFRRDSSVAESLRSWQRKVADDILDALQSAYALGARAPAASAHAFAIQSENLGL
jgi:hypothetical protein